MDELLPHFEYELGLLARKLTEFAERYPKIATRLGIQSGQVDDPHISRLVQTFAFMASALDTRLTDDYPEFIESLLGVINPQYLRCIPSCAIAEIDPAGQFGNLTGPFVIPRGTPLDARAALCRFKTIYDVTLTPLHVDTARYSPTTIAPAKIRLGTDATGILSVTFASLSATGHFDASIPSGPIRVHLSGERPVIAALTDTLLLRAANAFVEVDHDGRWRALSKVPVEAVGFDDNEALLPDDAGSAGLSFQYLLEYFAFPEKFDFIDIDLARIRRAASAPHARHLTLHVVVRDTPADSAVSQMLGAVSARTFKLFCTPIINLFERAAAPILLTDTDRAYPITPLPLEEKGVPPDLYAIDQVFLGEKSAIDEQKKSFSSASQTPRTPVPPYRAFSHSLSSQKVYWLLCRDRDVTLFNPRQSPWRLSLVGLDGQPARPEQPQVEIDLLATNGDLPSRLPLGDPQGDLLNEGAALPCPIRLLTRPTAPMTLTRGEGALWRVLATFSPQPFDLSRQGLGELKAFLRLHAPRAAIVAQQGIDALRSLGYKPAMKWMSLDGKMQSFVRGIEILVSIDESALRAIALNTFARILDRLFAPYAPTNSYVQLVIRSAQTDQELVRCEARPGTRALL
ncbi:type VI secretion protein [Burkholderia multivorans]|uniref:type VI secretion system baseplate subunit TssF n=1 Tax=Burkholderia multivorans TaxID=87883 RepID=UPI0019B17A1C|nr:type VI secretion system baseplate subunit TssF [Burkholderia multivorans]MBU9333412.1 type VI secretion system baseplate subunit TssF [Burkholderia multivorans]MBU9671408.1 type VI secretion system baseplate subunit TssF [Burkholderia multivorans]CAB5279006.1 type VI secretion protein [Burkholderia multivorans]CAB5285142.1 type VI secretion protein [Burkholderia multivorans]CAB5287438.1 type VI secretion protein [Burkholderia multivorans]